MSYTNDDLKIMQAWPLERKIQVTQTRIIEWYQHYNGQVYVSFSGGKDSTVLLDLARRIYPDIEAVFIDTGLEYPEIKKFVKTFNNVTIIKPEMKFNEVVTKHGYPVISKKAARQIRDLQNPTSKNINTRNLYMTGVKIDGSISTRFKLADKWKPIINSDIKVSEKCCDIMKKKPAREFGKKSGKKPMIAMMATDSEMRKSSYMKVGCNSFDNGKSNPMGFWTEQDVLHYLKEFNIDYCKIYGDILAKDQFNGQVVIDQRLECYEMSMEKRTGCYACMFGVHMEKGENRFQRMKYTHPKLYDYCMRPVTEKGLGLAEVLDFIGVEH